MTYVLRHGQFLNEEITFLGANFEIVKGPYMSMPEMQKHVDSLFIAVPTVVDNLLYLVSDIHLDPPDQWHEILDLTGKFDCVRQITKLPLAYRDPTFDMQLVTNIIRLYKLGFRVALQDFIVLNHRLIYIGCMHNDKEVTAFTPLAVLTRLAPYFSGAPTQLANFFRGLPTHRKSAPLRQAKITRFLQRVDAK